MPRVQVRFIYAGYAPAIEMTCRVQRNLLRFSAPRSLTVFISIYEPLFDLRSDLSCCYNTSRNGHITGDNAVACPESFDIPQPPAQK